MSNHKEVDFEDILKFFTEKYGKDYVDNCKIDKNFKVDKSIKMLFSEKNSRYIETYLQEICKTYKVSKFNLLFSECILKIFHSKCQLPSSAFDRPKARRENPLVVKYI